MRILLEIEPQETFNQEDINVIIANPTVLENTSIKQLGRNKHGGMASEAMGTMEFVITLLNTAAVGVAIKSISDIIKTKLKGKYRRFIFEFDGKKIDCTTDEKGIKELIELIKSMSDGNNKTE